MGETISVAVEQLARCPARTVLATAADRNALTTWMEGMRDARGEHLRVRGYPRPIRLMLDTAGDSVTYRADKPVAVSLTIRTDGDVAPCTVRATATWEPVRAVETVMLRLARRRLEHAIARRTAIDLARLCLLAESRG